MEKQIKIALAGNPNCGKTTLFNALTGSNQFVGNWPGVTVEKKERRLHAYGHDITVVDLPGIYSLSPYSMEEIVARNFVIEEKPDAVINIVDATNLERNLYLTVQLMELERPMVIALNMMDEVARLGVTIDCARLSRELGVPVMPIVARTGEGVDDLLRESADLLALSHEQLHAGFCIEPDDLYDARTHAAHHRIGEILGDAPARAGLPAHWAEIKLLEGDTMVRDQLQLTDAQAQVSGDYTYTVTAQNAEAGLMASGWTAPDGKATVTVGGDPVSLTPPPAGKRGSAPGPSPKTRRRGTCRLPPKSPRPPTTTPRTRTRAPPSPTRARSRPRSPRPQAASPMAIPSP